MSNLPLPVSALLPSTAGAGTSAAALAVSYLRVSTKEQAQRGGRDEGFSLPAQREANNRRAEALNAIVVEEFVEAGETGKNTDRPALKRLLEYIKTNKIAYCIVHKVDRLARNRLDDAMIHYELRSAGVMLVSVTENIDETPSGMLMHGIMSSLAEFYSLNLANEVVKGLTQKAVSGGTPARAPLGYLNVRERDAQGRELRTVAVDPDRAPLVTWAFHAYATGEWSIPMIHQELAARGLQTRPTPRHPSKPLAQSSVHRMLTNPYYRGTVVYRGVTYDGAHEPLIAPEVWYRVQNVLAVHNSAGDRHRQHEHYLKGSLFCGLCGSRMMISNAKNKAGNIYPYFVCSGRHSKRTTCTMRAILVEKAEQLVVEHYKTIQISPETRHALEGMLTQEFDTLHAAAGAERKDLTTQRDSLQDQRRKSLQAHYAGALPMDLLKEEQDRLSHQLALVEARLEIVDTEYETARTHLAECLALAGDCHTIYQIGSATTRRMANQAFFTKIFIDTDEHIRTEEQRPFTLLLDPVVQSEALGWADGKTRLTRTTADAQCSSKTRNVDLTGYELLTSSLRTDTTLPVPHEPFRTPISPADHLLAEPPLPCRGDRRAPHRWTAPTSTGAQHEGINMSHSPVFLPEGFPRIMAVRKGLVEGKLDKYLEDLADGDPDLYRVLQRCLEQLICDAQEDALADGPPPGDRAHD